ncbi:MULTISPECIES: DUF1850 domain-containing protein [unclassified Mesobacillus]|uniref:DUF1850 domain-containing protein n=1 Tax=unclassified Mesobacillus TaxID=2675270 RepID=UPI00203C76AB|nr:MULTISPECIES: DUF1850 domain-containing protein [unclassified Mesobacillus]MCM3124805.1 DUF1850 domain-containing protein [Mesobacillus sp. MER 33]MCM3232886.1 DUF1850 domain-containing protein [Mesobacillus sp. MER 48]
MKSIKFNKKIFVLLLLIMLILIISINIPYKQALVFLQPEEEDILCYVPIAQGDKFKIKYTHSIHLSDVIESYKITEQNEIQQYELEYEDFAIGMPSEIAEGEHFEMQDGKYRIKNMERRFKHFDLRVGKVRANHTFMQGKVSFPLSKAIEPGTRVRIQVMNINVIQQMKGVNILEHEE